MMLHSEYLNPFQPIAERNPREHDEGHCRTALENNMTRSTLSALSNAADPRALAMFVDSLAPRASEVLRERLRKIVQTLRGLPSSDWSRIEFDLLRQWPAAAMSERERLDVLVVGISCSHRTEWTHDGRCVAETCCPDASVYLPGKMLLVFECKNDEYPLDATQISEYVHRLKLLGDPQDVPRAPRGKSLTSEEATTVQEACKSVVLDVPWSAAVEALRKVEQSEGLGALGPWLCGRAADYLDQHIYPPYQGVATILDWLKGPAEPDRRKHLVTLVKKLGQSLVETGGSGQGGITFATNAKGNVDFPQGGGSAVYVKLARDGKPIQIDWVREKKIDKVDLVLWFDFVEEAEDKNKLIGLSYYLQATGCDANGKQSKAAWNRASKRRSACAKRFENEVQAWGLQHQDSRVIVGSVCFRGKSQMWKGGGAPDRCGPKSAEVSPQSALEFLRGRNAELWRFPRVGPGQEAATIAEAAAQVRKPAISMQFSLPINTLVEGRSNAQDLQNALRNAASASFRSAP